MLLPVVLYFLNLPNDVFAGKQLNVSDLKFGDPVADTGTDFDVGFQELEMASLTPESRSSLEGKTVRLTGRYQGSDSKIFTLTRYKMTCCAADAISINAVIRIDPDPKVKGLEPSQYRGKWVEVTGRVQFVRRRGSDEYITALVVYPTAQHPLSELIRKVNQPSDPFLN